MTSSSKTNQMTNLSDRVSARGSVDPAEIDHKSGQASQKTSTDPREHNSTVESRVESHHNTYSTVTKGNQVEESSSFTKEQKEMALTSIVEEEKRDHLRVQAQSQEENNDADKLIGTVKFSLSGNQNQYNNSSEIAAAAIQGLKFNTPFTEVNALFTAKQVESVGSRSSFLSEKTTTSQRFFIQSDLPFIFIEKTGAIWQNRSGLSSLSSDLSTKLGVDAELIVKLINSTSGANSQTGASTGGANSVRPDFSSAMTPYYSSSIMPMVQQNRGPITITSNGVIFDGSSAPQNNGVTYVLGDGDSAVTGTAFDDFFYTLYTTGNKTFSGLSGSDTYVFYGQTGGTHTITDFTPGQDVIDISEYGYGIPISFAGFTSEFMAGLPSQMIWKSDGDGTLILIDTNGDLSIDFSVRLAGVNPADLNPSDFIVSSNAAPSYVIQSNTTAINTGNQSSTIFTTDANLTSTVSISGATGSNTLSFIDTSPITVSANQFNNVTGVNAITFLTDATLTLNNNMVSSALSNTVTITSSGYQLSLDTSNLTGNNRAVINTTGAVTLLAAGAVYAASGLNSNISTSAVGGNQIFGNTGNDIIRNSSLIGSNSNEFTGGGGADQFAFSANAYSLVSNGTYTLITDFTINVDKIDLSVFNYAAPVSVLGNINSFSGSNQQELIWYQNGNHTIIAMDFDRNGVANWSIQLSNFSASSLTQSDFILPGPYVLTNLTDTINTGPYAYTISGSGHDLSSADTITGNLGTNTLLFTDNFSSLNANQFSGVTGVNRLVFDNTLADENTNINLTMNQNMVASALSKTVTIENGVINTTLDIGNLTSEESIIIGGTGGVTLAGSSLATVFAKDGVDTAIYTSTQGGNTIIGGSGDDRISDSSNPNHTANTLTGGAGSDTFAFAIYPYQSSNNGNTADTAITDLTQTDLVLIEGVFDRNTLTIGGNTNTFSGNGGAELIWYQFDSDTIFSMNFDGDQQADWSVVALNFNSNTLSSGNFAFTTGNENGKITLIVSGDDISSAWFDRFDYYNNIDMIQLAGNASITLDADIVSKTNSREIEIDNRNYTLTLDTSELSSADRALISGLGNVIFSGNSVIYAESGTAVTVTLGAQTDTFYGSSFAHNTIYTTVANLSLLDSISGSSTATMIFTDTGDIAVSAEQFSNIRNVDTIQTSGNAAIAFHDGMVGSITNQILNVDHGTHNLVLDTSLLSSGNKVNVTGTGDFSLGADGVVYVSGTNNVNFTLSAYSDTLHAQDNSGIQNIYTTDANLSSLDFIYTSSFDNTSTLIFTDTNYITVTADQTQNLVDYIKNIQFNGDASLALGSVLDPINIDRQGYALSLEMSEDGEVNLFGGAGMITFVNSVGTVNLHGVDEATVNASTSNIQNNLDDSVEANFYVNADYLTMSNIINGSIYGDNLIFTNTDAFTVSSQDMSGLSGIDSITVNADANLSLGIQSSGSDLTIYYGANNLILNAEGYNGNIYLSGTGNVTAFGSSFAPIYGADNIDLSLTIDGSDGFGSVIFYAGSNTQNTFYVTESGFSTSPEIYGSGNDTLISTSTGPVNISNLNITGVSTIELNSSATIEVSDSIFSNVAGNAITLNNGNYAVEFSAPMGLSSNNYFFIGGVGLVTFSAMYNSTLYAADGVNVSVALGGSNDTFYGGTGVDTIHTTSNDISSGDTIVGTGNDKLVITDNGPYEIFANQLSGITGVNQITVNGEATLTFEDGIFSGLQNNTLTLKNEGSNTVYLNTSALSVGNRLLVDSAPRFELTGGTAYIKDGLNGLATAYAGATIYGGTGNDSLTIAEGGGATLLGGSGNDTFYISGITYSTANTLTGGAGADTFVFQGYASSDIPINTTIADFSTADGDKFNLNGLLFGNTAYTLFGENNTFPLNLENQIIFFQDNLNALVKIDFDGDGNEDWLIQLSNFNAADLNYSDFILTNNSADFTQIASFSTLSPDDDTLTGTSGNDLFIVNDSFDLTDTDTISAGAGEDILQLNSGSYSQNSFTSVNGIDVIKTSGFVTLQVNDAIIDSGDDDTLEINHGSNTLNLNMIGNISSPNEILLNGTGQVRLYNDGAVTMKDGVNGNILTGDNSNQIINNGTGNTIINVGYSDNTVTVNGGNGNEVLAYSYYDWASGRNNAITFDGAAGENGITLSDIGEHGTHWSLTSGTINDTVDMGNGVTRFEFNDSSGQIQIDDGTTIQFQNVDYIDFH